MYPYILLFGRTIGTYGLCMVLGIFLAAFLAWKKGKPLGIAVEDILLTAACALLGGLFCGGLLYIFVTYSIEQIFAFIRQGDWSFLFRGIVFYGGLIGGVLGGILGIRITKCQFRAMEQAIVPFIPLGHAIGRIGCVMAGCCHGFAYDGPFALYYPNAVSGLDPTQGYFPIQLLEAICNCIICLVLLFLSKKERRAYALLFAYFALYAIERFVLEFFRGDAVRGIYFSLSSSQWISIALLAVCGIYMLWCRFAQKKE